MVSDACTETATVSVAEMQCTDISYVCSPAEMQCTDISYVCCTVSVCADISQTLHCSEAATGGPVSCCPGIAIAAVAHGSRGLVGAGPNAADESS